MLGGRAKLLKAVIAAQPSSEAEATYKAEQLKILKEIGEELQKGVGAQDYKGIRPH